MDLVGISIPVQIAPFLHRIWRQTTRDKRFGGNVVGAPYHSGNHVRIVSDARRGSADVYTFDALGIPPAEKILRARYFGIEVTRL